jgi:D-alanine-D-alanine ligase
LLDVQGYARIDAFVRVYKNKLPVVLFIEVNSLPGMTPATCIFQGYTPFNFIDRILKFGELRLAKH